MIALAHIDEAFQSERAEATQTEPSISHRLTRGRDREVNRVAEGCDGKGCMEAMPGDAISFDPPILTLEIDETRQEVATVLGMLMARHLFLPEDRFASELPLNRMGFDSLSLVHLAASIDLELGVCVPPERFAEGLTMSKLTELIALERSPVTSEPRYTYVEFRPHSLLLCA